jgi:hypothetical protein
MALRNANGRFRRAGTFDNKMFSANSTLAKGIAQFEFKMREGFEDIIRSFKDELVEYARSNAPWEDRTGDARSGLDAEFYGDEDAVGITLYHSVDYGVWLEIRWGGRYAIILPTVEAMGPKLLKAMERMMDKIIFYE